jgi:uncharacterized protein (TIGR02246 family)
MSDDEKAIRAVVERWMTASRTGDTATILELMTDDVVFMTPGREPFGKEAFAGQSNHLGDVHIDGAAEVREVQVIGEVAYIRNYLKIAMTPAGGQTARREGWTLTILRKGQDGAWRLSRDANLLPPF